MIYVIGPSQWINTGWILFGILGFPFIIPPLIALYMIIHVYCWKYEFHDGYIIEQKGVFTVHRTEINLERVKSIRMVEPFFYRFVGLSTVYVKSSDPFKPELKIVGIPEGKILVNSIKEETEEFRKRKGIKESDIHIL